MSRRREPLDLRLAPVAAAAWLFAGVGSGVPLGRALLAGFGLAALATVLWRLGGVAHPRWPRSTRHGVRTVAGITLVVAATSLTLASVRATMTAAGPVPALASEEAEVDLVLEVDSDPRLQQGQFGPYVLVGATVQQVVGRGRVSRVRSPVLVIGEPSWQSTHLGSTVAAEGRLTTSRGGDLAAVVIARGPPRLLQPPSRLERGIEHLRGSIREAVAPLGPSERALVPALVDGDDAAMPEETSEDFRAVGMTHLLAVSGTNLTLVLWCLLVVARGCGVRGYALAVVGVLATVLFVLLTRGEPSVLRAAAMGLVGLAGLTPGGQRRGVRALFLGIVALVLIEPDLASSVGFALSVIATASILLLAPVWRDALVRWMPRTFAEALAVPLAAQVVCTPVVMAISGQVSLVAVAANIVAAPAVGPATVLGLVGGLVGLVSMPLAHLVGWLAGVPAAWLVHAADRAAGLPGAAMEMSVGVGPVTLVSAVCVVIVVVMPRVLASRAWCVTWAVALTAAVWQPVQLGSWPTEGWVLAVCDVGQGDALVLHAGSDVGVVVDAGPDPAAVDRCLDQLGVTTVPLIVLTHFHADHVDGLPGVLEGRDVGEVAVTPLADPPDRVAAVRHWAAGSDVAVTTTVTGERRRVGEVSWTVIGPRESPVADDAGEGEGSAPNNASTMMLVESHGLRLLLTGDSEPEEEADVLASGVALDVDVLKLAHHGSSNQDWDFVRATRPDVAVVSVGADNTYGHPTQEALATMARLGAPVFRTDTQGTLLVSPGVAGGVRVTYR